MDKQHVECICPVCGKTYSADPVRLKWGRQTTCSRTCSYRLRADKLNTSADFACALCGRKFSRSPAAIKGKHGSQFCSRECHYAGRSLGLTKRVVTKPYQYTEASKAALSKAGADAAARIIQSCPSKYEDAAAAGLSRCGVAFIRQQVFTLGQRSISVDFFFPARSVVLEVDGPTHRKLRKEDAERDAALAALGFRVLRVQHTYSDAPEEVARAVLLALAG